MATQKTTTKNNAYELPYESRGTSTKNFSMNKASCEARGGFWDEATQTCIPKSLVKEELINPMAPAGSPEMGKTQARPLTIEEINKFPKGQGEIDPNYIPPTTTEAKAKPTTPEIFTDKNGRPSGITLPDGRTFLGLSPDEVNQIATREQGKTALPIGTQPVGTAQNQIEQQQRMQQLIQMAEQGLLTPQELQSIQGAEPSFGQAAEAGAIGILPGLIGGTVAGAAGGAFVGGVGAIPGAIVGGLAGSLTAFIVGAKNSIKGQQTEEFAKDNAALLKGTQYLRALVTDTNKYPEHAAENIELFYQTLNLIDAAHAKTYKDSQEDLNKALGTGGLKSLSKFEVFDNTMRQYYVRSFNAALTTPNPNAMILTAEDLNTELENE